MADTSIEIEIRALDNASRAFDGIERSLGPLNRRVRSLEGEFDRVDGSIGRVSGSFGRLRGLLAGAITVGGIAAFTNSVVEASSRAEDLRTTLETVTGSAQAGDEAFRFINDFATRTPFDIETLTETFIKLQAAGIEPTEELLTTFGDMAAVTTDRVGALNAITDLFSRTTAGGLGLEDLNRLADRGIPVFDILNEKLGVTRLEVSELGKTAEGAEQIRQALVEGLNEDFGGGMERASQNLSVSLSNLGIAANNALIKVGEGGLTDAINRAATTFTDFILANEDLALALGERMGQAVTLVTDGFIWLMENLDRAQPLFDLLGTVFNDILVPAFSVFFEIVMAVAEAMTPIIERIAPAATTLFEGLGGVMTDIVIPAFESVIETIGRVIERIQGMIEWIGAGIDRVRDFGSGVASTVSSGFNRAGDTIGGWAESVNNWGASVYEEWIGNSYIPDLVYGIGKYMDMLPREMVEPARRAVLATNQVMERSPLINLPTSPVSGIGQGIGQIMSGASTANANVNFNISGINAGQTGQFQQAQMRQYIEGIALQVATSAIRQNTRLGGLL